VHRPQCAACERRRFDVQEGPDRAACRATQRTTCSRRISSWPRFARLRAPRARGAPSRPRRAEAERGPRRAKCYHPIDVRRAPCVINFGAHAGIRPEGTWHWSRGRSVARRREHRRARTTRSASRRSRRRSASGRSGSSSRRTTRHKCARRRRVLRSCRSSARSGSKSLEPVVPTAIVVAQGTRRCGTDGLQVEIDGAPVEGSEQRNARCRSIPGTQPRHGRSGRRDTTRRRRRSSVAEGDKRVKNFARPRALRGGAKIDTNRPPDAPPGSEPSRPVSNPHVGLRRRSDRRARYRSGVSRSTASAVKSSLDDSGCKPDCDQESLHTRCRAISSSANVLLGVGVVAAVVATVVYFDRASSRRGAERRLGVTREAPELAGRDARTCA
jgi:hypothetical protein